MTETPIAVLGLGEAGSAFASALIAAGAHVRAYDPVVKAPPGAVDCTDEADAVRTAGLVLSVNTARAAFAAFQAAAEHLASDAVWVDMNTTEPSLKQRLSTLASTRGVAFADFAIMAPVPVRGLATPLLASGQGARRAASVLGAYGACVEVLDAPAGRQPSESSCAVCSTRACRRPSSRRSRRHAPWVSRTGCGTTSLRNSPTHPSTHFTASSPGLTATPHAGPTRWPPS